VKKIFGITIVTAIICMGLVYHKSNNIINPNNIISIQFSDRIKTDRQEIKNKDIKLIDIILIKEFLSFGNKFFFEKTL